MRGIESRVEHIVPDIQHAPEQDGEPEVFEPDPDYAGWTDEEVADLCAKAGRELRRRQTMNAATAQAEVAAQVWLAASGRRDGDPWVQPTSTVDAYREGDIVTHEGRTWESMTRVNTWEPPTHWREVVEEGEAPADWARPASTEDAYARGDLVTFEGQVYRSVWPNPNTWSPTEFPDAWELVP